MWIGRKRIERKLKNKGEIFWERKKKRKLVSGLEEKRGRWEKNVRKHEKQGFGLYGSLATLSPYNMYFG